MRTTRNAVTPGEPEHLHLDDPALLLDPDLSRLEFQRRVLDEARDPRNPLLERVRFLSIVGSNLDEFAMTRLGALAPAGGARVLRMDAPMSQSRGRRERIETLARTLMLEAREYLTRHLAPELADAGIHLRDYLNLDAHQRAEADRYFEEAVLPLLMPLGFDATRPFPHLTHRDITFAVVLRSPAGRQHFACLQVPSSTPLLVPVRHLRLEASGGNSMRTDGAIERGYVWLDQVIAANLPAVFRGMHVIGAYPFRVIRDAEIRTDAIDSDDGWLSVIEQGVHQREFAPIRVVAVAEDMPEELVDLLARNLCVPESIVHRTKHLRDLRRLGELLRVERPDLKYAPSVPPLPMALRPVHGCDIFSAIRARDILLHHPFESFQPVVDFVRQSAVDPSVLGISMTLYRVDRDSPIVSSLIEAARAGKQVRVVVELRARFDETNNIAWARALERAGAHVTYGMPELKVHAKIAMVVRREGEKVRTYVHVSSGNYNTGTACAYTDVGLLTCDEDIARDATDMFNFLTGHAAPSAFRKMIAAPATLKRRVTELIGNEIAHRQAGRPGRIILKMNALSDPGIIRLLYLASQCGVEIDLIIRGICCLRPGVPGVSDHIRVRSIVGRFLEHSRIWYFRNGGQERVFIGSADLMPRNFERRVEVMIPVEEGSMLRRIRDEILAAYLDDDVKAWRLRSDGDYERAPGGGPGGASQEALLT